MSLTLDGQIHLMARYRLSCRWNAATSSSSSVVLRPLYTLPTKLLSTRCSKGLPLPA